MLPKNAHRNARLRKAWLDRRSEIITPESVCSICGSSSISSILQIHHSSKEAYKEENFHLYEILSPELPYSLICKKCHFASHKGMNLCPQCHENYKQAHFPTCFKCSGKELSDFQKLWYDIIFK